MPRADVRTISPDQYREAYGLYCVYAANLCREIEAVQPHLRVDFDRVVALNVAIATYDDIGRYKAYHLNDPIEERSDVVKRAAYFVKWTVKLRPIFVERRSDVNPEVDLGLIPDETLAVSLAMDLISADIGKRVRLTEKAEAAMLYDLRYRELTGDGLMATFQTIVDLAKAGQDNPIVEFGVA